MKKLAAVLVIATVAAGAFAAGRAMWKYPWVSPQQLRDLNKPTDHVRLDEKCYVRSVRRDPPIELAGLKVIRFIGAPESRKMLVIIELAETPAGGVSPFAESNKEREALAKKLVAAALIEIRTRFCDPGPKGSRVIIRVDQDGKVVFVYSRTAYRWIAKSR